MDEHSLERVKKIVGVANGIWKNSRNDNKLDEIGDKLYYTMKTETEDKDRMTPTYCIYGT